MTKSFIYSLIKKDNYQHLQTILDTNQYQNIISKYINEISNYAILSKAINCFSLLINSKHANDYYYIRLTPILEDKDIYIWINYILNSKLIIKPCIFINPIKNKDIIFKLLDRIDLIPTNIYQLIVYYLTETTFEYIINKLILTENDFFNYYLNSWILPKLLLNPDNLYKLKILKKYNFDISTVSININGFYLFPLPRNSIIYLLQNYDTNLEEIFIYLVNNTTNKYDNINIFEILPKEYIDQRHLLIYKYYDSLIENKYIIIVKKEFIDLLINECFNYINTNIFDTLCDYLVFIYPKIDKKEFKYISFNYLKYVIIKKSLNYNLDKLQFNKLIDILDEFIKKENQGYY